MDFLFVEQIECGEFKIKLRKPYRFGLNFTEEYYIVDDDYLDIHICEKNIDEVKRSISQEFVFLYNAYAEEKDENLTKGAQVLKRKIIDLIEGVYYDRYQYEAIGTGVT